MNPKLTAKQRKEKQEGFMMWITFIDDRVDEWKATILPGIAAELDWSIESLSVLGKYILDTYQFETAYVPENKQAIDAMASYIGEVYRKHIPNAKWYMELNMRTDIDFGRPVVRVPIGPAFSPYPLVLTTLYEKSGQLLRHLYNLRIANMKEHGMI